MGAAQPPQPSESDTDPSSASEDGYAENRGRGGSAAGKNSAKKPGGRVAGMARSSSSLASSSALSSARSSRLRGLAGASLGAAGLSLCPCCDMQVGNKEYLRDDSAYPPGIARGRTLSSGSSVSDTEEEKEGERRGGRQRDAARQAGGRRERHVEDGEKRDRDVEQRGSQEVGGRIGARGPISVAAPLDFAPSARRGAPAEDDDDDARSARSAFSVSTAIVGSAAGLSQGTARPKDSASLKLALKAFVQGMVAGKELHIPGAGGSLREVTCKLTAGTEALLVLDAGSRRKVPLKDVLHVHHGLEAMPLDLGLDLDANMVVLEMAGGDFIALHAGHTRGAEDIVLYLRLLTAIQRKQLQAAADAGDAPALAVPVMQSVPRKVPWLDDDARSECSVQSGIVQQQLNVTPMSAVASSDPKEAKRMFKMFTETMRRGRDFYVVRADGGLYDVECSLSKGHDEFRMRWDGQTRAILLQDILNVLTSREVGKLQVNFTLDDRLATLELLTGECITFKFGHAEACERFVLCMRILVEQKRPRFATKGFDACAVRTQSGGAEIFEMPSASAPASERRGHGQRGGGARQSVPEDTKVGPKAVVEQFVRQMVAGSDLHIVGPAGLQPVRCSMDVDLQELRLGASDGSSHCVRVSEVKAVHVGREAAHLGLSGLAMEPLCATMELKSGDCATFRLPDAEQRDRFAICMRIFASAYPG